eukprot:17573-Heterococcus_DN1.PRE.4
MCACEQVDGAASTKATRPATCYVSNMQEHGQRTAVLLRQLCHTYLLHSCALLFAHAGCGTSVSRVASVYCEVTQCYTVQPSEQIDDLEIFGAAYCIVPARIACKLVLFCSCKFFNMRAHCSAHTNHRLSYSR